MLEPCPPTAGLRLLTALAGTQLLVALDFSIIYVALPDIGESLHFSGAALQWIVSAYAIFFAGFLLLGGQLVDTFGGGSIGLALLVLLQGEHLDPAAFALTFCVTTAVALAVVPAAWRYLVPADQPASRQASAAGHVPQ